MMNHLNPSENLHGFLGRVKIMLEFLRVKQQSKLVIAPRTNESFFCVEYIIFDSFFPHFFLRQFDFILEKIYKIIYSNSRRD